MSKKMTFREWKDKNYGFINVLSNIDELTENYAKYYHAEMSKPPKDVEEAIEIYCDNCLVWDEDNAHDVVLKGEMATAARFGYSLASKWVRVEDALPEMGERVLVFTSKGDMIVCFTNMALTWKTIGLRKNYYLGDIKVTHWQPLPPKPNEI